MGIIVQMVKEDLVKAGCEDVPDNVESLMEPSIFASEQAKELRSIYTELLEVKKSV
jgi:hypothetical protein